MAKGVTSKSRNKDEENKRREEQQKPHSEQKQTTQKQKPGQSKPQNETPATSRPATQEVAPKPTSTQIPTLEPKYASPEQIEEARDFGRRSLEMARAGQLDMSEKIPFTQGVEGYAEQYRIPELEGYQDTASYAPETRQDRAEQPSYGTSERDYMMQQNAARNEQRRAERQPVDILGSRLEAGQSAGMDKYSEKMRPESSFDVSTLSEKDAGRFEKLNNSIARISSRMARNGGSVEDQRALSALQAEKAKIMGQNLVSDEANADDVISEWLDPDYKMGRSEVEQAKQIIQDYENNEYKNSNIYDLTDEESAKLSQINALRDKVSKAESAIYGMENATINPLMVAADRDFYGWSVDDLRDEVARQRDLPMSPEVRAYVNQLQGEIDALQSQLDNADTVYSTGDAGVDEVIGSNTQSRNAAELRRDIEDKQAQMYKLMLEESRGNNKPNYDSYSLRKANAQKQNPVPYLAGDMGTRMLESMAIQGAMGSNGWLADMATDALTDTLPEYEANLAGGMSRKDAGNQALISAALNTAMDTGAWAASNADDIASMFARSARENADNVIPAVARTQDEVIENAARQADEIPTMDPAELARQNEIDVNAKVDDVNQAVDEITDLAEQIPEAPAQPIEQAARNTPDVENSASNIIPATTKENYVPHSRQGEAPAFDMPEYRADYSKGITENVKSLEMPNDVRGYVDSKVKTLDDIFDRIDNAQTKEELDGLYKELNDTVKDLDDTLKDSAQARLIPKRTFDDNTKSFVNAIKGMTINVPDNVRAELPNQTLKQLEARLHFYGDGQNINVHLRKNSGIGIDSVFEDIDAATGHALSSFMEQNGLNPDVTENQLKGILEYADYLKETQNSTKVMDYTGGIFDDYVLEAKRRINARSQALFDARKATKSVSAPTAEAVPAMPDDIANFEAQRQQIFQEIDEATARGEDPSMYYGMLNDLEEDMRSAHPEMFDAKTSEYVGASRGSNNVSTPEVKPEPTEPNNVPVGGGNVPPNTPPNGGGNPPTPNEPIDLTRGPSGDLKERGTSEHIRSIEDVRVATPMKMEGVSDEVVADFVDNPDMYKVLKNADTKALADDIYNSGDQAIRIGDNVYTGDVETKFGKLLSEKNPAALPLGHQLAKDYSEAGNHDMAAQIYRRMGEELTKAGQFSQAAAINMMRNDPLTALQYAEKQLEAINQQGAKRFGDKWKTLSLTDDEIQAFNSIAPGNAEAIKALYDKIGARLGKEYPTTFMEKLLEGRKVAMLFNVRTNVRNVGANVPTLGLRWVSDRVAALGEGAAHLINPNFARTQALTGSGIRGRKIASEIYNSPQVKALIEGTSGKYEIPELQNSLMKDRQMFKGTPVSKWINRVTNGGIEKVNKRLFGKEGVESGLETIRNATYKMLDLGDSPFVRENFIERLGSYINAQKIKDVSQVPDEAIQTAWEEAMKATYKDNSWAVKMLSGIKGGIEQIPGIGKPLSQAVIPFLQAPGNIAARMVDYSPIKATTGVYHILSGAANKSEQAVRKGIDEAAKGLTGSGLIILGMKLREAGLLTGDYSEDKDQKNFEKQNGFIPWSLHIGDKYFQYDWAQPFAEPLIVGSLLQEAIDNSDQYDSDILNHFGVEGSAAGTAIGLAKEGTRASVNSWFNASPLQGLAELMSGGYNGTDIAQNIFDAGVSDFAGAFVPSLVNAIAKTEDTTQRQTYDPSSKFNTFLNQQQAKIPGLSEDLPVKYDTWGEEMKYANSKPEAFAQRFAIPGNYGTDTNDPIDIEINNLFNDTQDAKVFPWTAANKVGDRQLNNREISNYQRDMGQRSRQVVEGFINSDVYKTMDSDEKVNALNEIYNISKTITERDMFGKPVADNSQYKKAVEAYDEGNIDGLLDYINAKNNPYGLDLKVYQKMLDNNEDFAPYEGYKEAQREYDIEDKEAYREAYVNGGNEALAQEVEYQNALKEFDLSDSKTARNEWNRALHASADPMAALQKVAESKTLLDEANVQGNSKIGEAIQAAVGSGNIEQAQSMVQSTATIQDLGLTKPGPAYTYVNAQNVFPNLTVEQFADTYKAMDADGNQGLKQTEIIDYFNSHSIPSVEGGKLWAAYGSSTWKRSRYLEMMGYGGYRLNDPTGKHNQQPNTRSHRRVHPFRKRQSVAQKTLHRRDML